MPIKGLLEISSKPSGLDRSFSPVVDAHCGQTEEAALSPRMCFIKAQDVKKNCNYTFLPLDDMHV